MDEFVKPFPRQRRVILWSTPRSCSSLFTKAISAHQNIHILHEKFFKCFYFGEECVSDRYHDNPNTFSDETTSGLTFQDIKNIYEQEYEDFDVVFGKEMALYMTGKLDNMAALPQGYQHTFLIRKPTKVFPSLYKCLTDVDRNATNAFGGIESQCYQPLRQLFDLVKQTTRTTPVLVDADDLLKDPASVLKVYCEKTGLQYEPEMLHWGRSCPVDVHWRKWPGWYGELMQSTGFIPVIENESGSDVETASLPEDVVKCIRENEHIYHELYQYRTLPKNWSTRDKYGN